MTVYKINVKTRRLKERTHDDKYIMASKIKCNGSCMLSECRAFHSHVRLFALFLNSSVLSNTNV